MERVLQTSKQFIWLGYIPKEWKLNPLNTITYPISIKDHSEEEILSLYRDYGVIIKKSRSDNHNRPGSDLSKYKLVSVGDLVINKMKAWQGSVGISKYRGIISPAYIVCKVDKNFDSEYLNYLLRCNYYKHQYGRLSYGVRTDQWDIRYDDFKKLPVLIPPKQEQTAIANFLDYKLAKINRFIQKKKQLIKLLNEQKAAIINEMVTGKKVWNGNAWAEPVKVKDSGIEWMGEKPEHWQIYKLTGVCDFVRGNSSFKKDELLTAGKYVALQYGKTYKVNEVDEKYQFYVDEEFYKVSQIVKNGDVIIISTSETIEDLGHSIFYNRSDYGLLGGEQILLRPKNNIVIGKYLCYSSMLFAQELRKYATGVKVFRFNITDLKTIYSCVPPIEEQKQIVNYIEIESQRIDTTILKIEKELALTEEYKTALIAEAVTGKIDVRNYNIPETKGYVDLEEFEEEMIAAEDEVEYQTVEE